MTITMPQRDIIHKLSPPYGENDSASLRRRAQEALGFDFADVQGLDLAYVSWAAGPARPGGELNPHSSDDALSFGAACAIQI